MSFEENETVIILEDSPNEGIKKGDIGTIIMVYETPNKAYEVEFVDEEGSVKFQGVYHSNQIAKLK
ncbi:DUF4926 domain-containing protein [Bacillus timonensis]|nr:DUF4926 domain-containing protein [Bacillus timonensis]